MRFTNHACVSIGKDEWGANGEDKIRASPAQQLHPVDRRAAPLLKGANWVWKTATAAGTEGAERPGPSAIATGGGSIGAERRQKGRFRRPAEGPSMPSVEFQLRGGRWNGLQRRRKLFRQCLCCAFVPPPWINNRRPLEGWHLAAGHVGSPVWSTETCTLREISCKRASTKGWRWGSVAVEAPWRPLSAVMWLHSAYPPQKHRIRTRPTRAGLTRARQRTGPVKKPRRAQAGESPERNSRHDGNAPNARRGLVAMALFSRQATLTRRCVPRSCTWSEL